MFRCELNRSRYRFKSSGKPAAEQRRKVTAARKFSVTELQLLGDLLIAVDVRVVEIIQKTAALADHHEQPTAGAVIFFVGLQMSRKMIDAFGKQSDLHVRGSGIFLVQLKALNRFGFRFHICLVPQNNSGQI
jgi:hypothetical protein